jgi:hypothetical protein
MVFVADHSTHIAHGFLTRTTMSIIPGLLKPFWLHLLRASGRKRYVSTGKIYWLPESD